MLQYDLSRYEIKKGGERFTMTGHEIFTETNKLVSAICAGLIGTFTGQIATIGEQTNCTLRNCLPEKGRAEDFNKWLFETYLTPKTYGTGDWLDNCRRCAEYMAREMFREDIEAEINRRGGLQAIARKSA